MRPVAKNNLLEKDDDDDDDDASGKTGFPTWLKTRQIFALTACNPYGKEVEEWQNARANEKLKVKLRELADKRRRTCNSGARLGFHWQTIGEKMGSRYAFESDATSKRMSSLSRNSSSKVRYIGIGG